MPAMNALQGTPLSQHSRETNWLVVALCFFPVLLDGFDATVLSLSVPALASGWGIAPAAFTLPLVATSIGVFVGYLGSGWLARGVGRRRLVIGSTALFSAGTLATALIIPAHSIEALTLVRLLTGLGFGGVLPSGVAFATDFSSDRRRDVVPLLVALGFSAGATGAGFVYQQVVGMVGVSGLFWLAGLVSAAMVIPLLVFLPPEPTGRVGTSEGRRAERAGQLLERAVRVDTLLLWVYAFLVFVVSTALSSWVPVLITELGVPVADAPLGLAFIYLGAIVGGVLVIPIAAWAGIGRTLIMMPLLCALLLLWLVGFDLGGVALLVALAGVGAGISASQNGQLGMAVSLYPHEHRTTGIGWSSAMGRAGSIAGPGVTGILLGAGASASTIFSLAAAATAIAVVCAVVLQARMRNRMAQRS